MALPQLVTKTYSRRRLRQSDVSHAERTFDEVLRGESRPPARAAATAEKWGAASFKRISNATRASPKRRLSPTHDSDDPFSFDSDDDNSAKKLKKENIRQKTAATATAKLTGGLVDGHLTNCEEKSSSDERHFNKTATKQCAQKVTRCRPGGIQAKLASSVDCAANERNGLYRVAAASERGDSVQLSERNCRSSGREDDGSCDKKPSSRAAGRNTRGTDLGAVSPCKTTQQLKVFVDNFQQLFSSQRRSPGAVGTRHSLPADASASSDKLSSARQLDSPAAAATKSKSSENCRSDSRHLPSSPSSRHSRGTAVKAASSSLQHSRPQQNNAAAADSDSDADDDDEVILLTPVPVRPRSSAHRPSDTGRTSDAGKTVSGNCSLQSASSKSSSSTPNASSATSRSQKSVASSEGSKNEAVSERRGLSRSRRRRSSDESAAANAAAAAAAAAASITTSTRRLLTGSGSRKVSFRVIYCSAHQASIRHVSFMWHSIVI